MRRHHCLGISLASFVHSPIRLRSMQQLPVSWVYVAGDLRIRDCQKRQDSIDHAATFCVMDATLAGLPKDLVALFEELSSRMKRGVVRHNEPGTLEPLQAMFQHRPVHFLEDIQPDFDRQVRSDPEHVLVEGCVMEFAERQAVLDDGSPLRVTIRENVSGV